MPEMRHRDGKLKIMHTIIGDFAKVLRQIASLEIIESVLTGTIAPSKSYKDTLTFQYYTDNGLKLLAKTTTAVQEIFIVTAQPELLLDELQKTGFVEQVRKDVKHNGPKKSQRRKSWDEPTETNPEQISKNSVKNPTMGKENDPVTLRQRISPDALSALLKVKEEATSKQQIAINQKPAKKLPMRSIPRQKEFQEQDEDFAALFTPKDDDLTFEELLNQSKLDPKFFK